MVIPDNKILAVSREEAVGLLEKAGIRVEVRETRPPVGPAGAEGREMVVRFLLRGDTGIITVAREMRSEK